MLAAGVSLDRPVAESSIPTRRPAAAGGAAGRRIGTALLALFAGCVPLAQKPLPPRVTLEAVRVTRFTATEARFTVALAVDNPNAYDLAVNALDALLAVEGEPLLAGALAAPTVLAGGAATRVDVEARTTPAAVAAVLERIARRPTVRYEVTGTAVVQDGLRLPFGRSGELPAGELLGGKR
jgi:LEA14-like dessication related protein